MMCRCLNVALALALFWPWIVPTTAHAGKLFPFFKDNSPQHAPEWVGNPKRIVAAPPGPHRYPEYNAYCPWYGYGLGVPTYQWGYFGATYRPACVAHDGYYGTYTQWGYRWGY